MISSLTISKKSISLREDEYKSSTLVLSVSANAFELAEFTTSPIHIFKVASWEFPQQVKDIVELNDYLIQFINEHHLSQKQFRSVYVNWNGNHFTLMPNSFFEPEKAGDLLEFNIGKNPDEIILNNEVEEIKLIYSIPSEIKNTLDKLFPHHQLKHIGYSTVKLFFNHFQLKNADLFLNIHHNNIEIAVKKDKKPLLYNLYSTLSDEDILYYLMFTIEQMGLNPASCKISIAANRETSAEIFTAIKKYVKHVDFAVSDKIFIRKGEMEKIPHHFYFNTFNFLLCE